jgi:hypothetical protein
LLQGLEIDILGPIETINAISPQEGARLANEVLFYYPKPASDGAFKGAGKRAVGVVTDQYQRLLAIANQ